MPNGRGRRPRLQGCPSVLSLPIPGCFRHPRAPMRWLAHPAAGAILRRGLTALFFLANPGGINGQTIELSSNSLVHEIRKAMTAGSVVIFGQENLSTESEPPLPPSEFNPDPG